MYATLNSFDLLRVVASILVMFSHSLALTGIREPIVTNGYTLGNVAVFFFFSLSGYLVYQSLERDPNVFRFLARRALWIFPGLAVVLALTVLVLGPACSSLAVKDYFVQSETWAYLAKIRLYGSDRLPGVFEQNPYPNSVNSSLWTLKWEWLMYCIMAVFAYVLRGRHALFTLILLGGLFPLVAAYISFDVFDGVGFLKDAGVSRAFSDFIVLACFFWAGSLLAMVRQFFRPSVWLTAIVTTLAIPTLGTNIGILGLIAAIPLLVVALGESGLQQGMKLTIRNDLSYGIYIYAFPIQQAVSMVIPGIEWYVAFVVALVGTVLAAYFSWRFIESPSLNLKKALRKV